MVFTITVVRRWERLVSLFIRLCRDKRWAVLGVDEYIPVKNVFQAPLCFET
jgi:hypothetical protein